MGGINTMRRAGFPTEPFVVGDRITITGNPGRRGRTIRLRSVVLQDGTRLNEDSEMSDLADDQERHNNAILVALALWFPSSIGLSGLNVGPTTLLNHDVAPDGSRFVAIFPGGVDDDGSSRDQIVTVQNWFEELRRLVPTN